MDKQQLASKIWSAANEMRGNLDANDYKDLILGLMFYKFLSDRVRVFIDDQDVSVAEAQEAKFYDYMREELHYVIEYKDLFTTWRDDINELKSGDVVEGVRRFEGSIHPDYKDIFDNVFEPLVAAVPKLGNTALAQAKTLRKLIGIVNDIPTGGAQSYDVLGYVYEYLISQFAANAGAKAGEFYTPHEVAQVMSEIVGEHLKDSSEIKIYDPTSGSASLLLRAGEIIGGGDKSRVKYYAQELKQDAYALTRMNLVMNGVPLANIETRMGNTLEEDWPIKSANGHGFEPLRVDAVVSNPPYSAHWDRDRAGSDPRFNYGIAPARAADYAFLLHDLYHLKDDGILTIVLPHGVLFRGGEERKIRRSLVDYNHVDAVIGLPANIFFGTGIATIVMVLRKNRGTLTDTLFIDASKGFIKAGKKNELRQRDIRKIVDTVIERREETGYSRAVPREELIANDYNLNIPRYIDSAEPAPKYDIYATMFGGIPHDEIDDLEHYWRALPGLRESIFVSKTPTHARLSDSAAEQLPALVKNHQAVLSFKESYSAAFTGWADELRGTLIDSVYSVDTQNIVADLRQQLFSRLAAVPLVDRYEIYEIFAKRISATVRDIDLLQRDGWQAVRQVVPNMVTKKSKSEKAAAQENWSGLVIPFDIVQQQKFAGLFSKLAQLHARQTEISARISSLFESLDEEQLQGVTSKGGTDFASKTVLKSYLESRLADISTPEIEILQQYQIAKDADKKLLIAENPEVAWQLMAQNKNGSYSKTTVNQRIASLQRAAEFGQDAIEPVIIEVLDLLETSDAVKKELRALGPSIELETKEFIESISDDDAKHMLKIKWVDALLQDIAEMPDKIIAQLIDRVETLSQKYATTLSDIGCKTGQSQAKLADMLEQLTGSQQDIAGISELAAIMRGTP